MPASIHRSAHGVKTDHVAFGEQKWRGVVRCGGLQRRLKQPQRLAQTLARLLVGPISPQGDRQRLSVLGASLQRKITQQFLGPARFKTGQGDAVHGTVQLAEERYLQLCHHDTSAHRAAENPAVIRVTLS